IDPERPRPQDGFSTDSFGEEPMNVIDKLAARLQRLRKLLIVITILLIGFCTLIAVRMGPSGSAVFCHPLTFIAQIAFTWCWGLFCVAAWYAPSTGPLCAERLNPEKPVLSLIVRLLRVVALIALALWILSPFVLLIVLRLQKP
ncbi:MAG TPA: hypothetical protein PLU30_16150, partial [Verrucomicrobiae bacterium]|nr:hypothetical protein [Verrucomicrobiae bacterium]